MLDKNQVGKRARWMASQTQEVAIKLIQALYEFFVSNPNELPNEYITIAWKEGAERAACDYIAGMTDDYVLKVYGDYFIPKGWNY